MGNGNGNGNGWKSTVSLVGVMVVLAGSVATGVTCHRQALEKVSRNEEALVRHAQDIRELKAQAAETAGIMLTKVTRIEKILIAMAAKQDVDVRDLIQ